MMINLNKIRSIFTKKEQLQFIFLFGIGIVMALTQLVGVASIIPFIGMVIEPKMIYENRWLYAAYEHINYTSVQTFTIFFGTIMFVVILFANFLSAYVTWYKLKVSWTINHKLSIRLLKKYLAKPYAFFLNQNSADLCKNILNEVDILTNGYLIPLLTIITKGLVVVLILVMLAWIDFITSIIAVIFIGGGFLLIYMNINKKLKQHGEERMTVDKARYMAAFEIFGGIKEIKVLNNEEYFLNRYEDESRKHARLISWNEMVRQLPRFAIETLAFAGIILFVLVLMVTQNDSISVITKASLFAFAGYRLMPALQEIFSSLSYVRFNQVVLDRIYNDVTDGSHNVKFLNNTSGEKIEPIPFKEEIRLSNISYYYPNAKNHVVKDINLSILCNNSVAFVGPTGAGKTTLVDIILGLLKPQEGFLVVDGQRITEKNLKNWQANLGYVPQHIYLCDDSITRNIAFGVPDMAVDQVALINAAKLSNLHDFIINELPDNYNTIIGERGIRLSGGQRQRIGIARALYHKFSVIIFDEATSALDGVTEEAILTAMENVAKIKTLIIIAHRLNTVKNCDIIYLLDKGKIVDSGTYEALLESNNQFKAMAKIK